MTPSTPEPTSNGIGQHLTALGGHVAAQKDDAHKRSAEWYAADARERAILEEREGADK